MTLEDGLYAHAALTTAPAGSALAAVQTQLADTDPIVIRRLWAIQLTQGVDRWPALTYHSFVSCKRLGINDLLHNIVAHSPHSYLIRGGVQGTPERIARVG